MVKMGTQAAEAKKRGKVRPPSMDRERLVALQKFYVEQGIVQKESPVADLFTNEFLQ